MKNVLINEDVIELLKSESISESFLCENMANIERVALDDCFAKDDIGFISSWKKVKELFCGLGFEFGCLGDIRWPHLATICSGTTYGSDLEYKDFIAFLKPHANITKLHFEGFSDEDESGMTIEFIAKNLPNLIDLDVGGFSANKNSSLLSALSQRCAT